jgi:hypothetical protein
LLKALPQTAHPLPPVKVPQDIENLHKQSMDAPDPEQVMVLAPQVA